MEEGKKPPATSNQTQDTWLAPDNQLTLTFLYMHCTDGTDYLSCTPSS